MTGDNNTGDNVVNFCSDNVTGASPEIVEAVVKAASQGPAMPYGADPWTERVEAKLKDIFETDLVAFPVATGTAANALALSVMTPPFGAVFCHPHSHIYEDECGAPEFYSGGAKLITVDGEHGKIDLNTLNEIVGQTGALGVHSVQPAVITITQASEAGTVYTAEEVAGIAQIAKTHSVGLHMDGARFANAMSALDCTPADITWRVGVEALSFGATKNGALAAEAVIFFNKDLAGEFGFRRKRGGHLFSKARFLSAQLDAYLENDLWLTNAAHANAAATRLADGLLAIDSVTLMHPVEANELFVVFPPGVSKAIQADGFAFYDEEAFQAPFVRLVTAFNTQNADVDAFIESAKQHVTACLN